MTLSTLIAPTIGALRGVEVMPASSDEPSDTPPANALTLGGEILTLGGEPLTLG